MIDAEIRSAVWTLFKQGKKKLEIARLLDLDKKTVFKIIDQDGLIPDRKRKDKIEPDRELIKRVHKSCEGYARRTHEVLTSEYTIEIGYSTLTRLLAEIAKEENKRSDDGPPQIVRPGEFMQHDTSPHVIGVGGKRILLQCAGLYFRYSKVRYIKYYPSFNKFAMKSFFYEALMFWKYAAATCVIDNTSLAVLRGTGPNAVFHDDMNAFAKRLGFAWLAHPLKKPNWKAGKERNFLSVETNFIPGRSFKDMEDLNRQVLAWATEKYFLHPDDKTKLVPVQQWELEKPYLQAIPDYVHPPYQEYNREADKNGFIPVYSNYYWVPGAKQQSVKVIEIPGQIKLYLNNEHEPEIEYLLKPCDVKYQQVTPEGCPMQKKPHRSHLTSEPEETKLRQTHGETIGRYLEFIQSKEGAVRNRNPFIKNLYGISLRVAPTVFKKAIERALIYRINNCETIERIVFQLMRQDTQEWPEVAAAENFEKREAYLQGRLSDEPDLFSYAELLKPTDQKTDGGIDHGSGSKDE
jgi:hypothetical protein